VAPIRSVTPCNGTSSSARSTRPSNVVPPLEATVRASDAAYERRLRRDLSQQGRIASATKNATDCSEHVFMRATSFSFSVINTPFTLLRQHVHSSKNPLNSQCRPITDTRTGHLHQKVGMRNLSF
jgi:hypothetical protein